ncbi:hypothetical protein L204_100710 [Cryptococcus depauperatus]
MNKFVQLCAGIPNPPPSTSAGHCLSIEPRRAQGCLEKLGSYQGVYFQAHFGVLSVIKPVVQPKETEKKLG